MIEVSDIILEWKTDSKLDEILVDSSALKIACLHSKYVEYLLQLKKQLRSLKRKKKDFPISNRRGNDLYLSLEDKVSEHEDGIDMVEKIIYSVNQMSFTLNTIVKWRCHLKGVDVL